MAKKEASFITSLKKRKILTFSVLVLVVFLFGFLVALFVVGKVSLEVKTDFQPDEKKEVEEITQEIYKYRSEKDEIIKAARRYVLEYSAPEIEFDLKLRNRFGEYALVEIIPIPSGAFEGGAVVLQKISGLWVAIEMGTFFPELEQEVPELFNW